jgi:diguanylate cyclase (GGDEF)-like protein
VIEREPLAVFLFDLDRFKEINDRLGHALGDKVLQTFAGTATQTLGSDVMFGRIGGEEFATIFPVGDLGEAVAVADRVRRNFATEAVQHADGDLSPTVSIGVTLGIDPNTDVDALLAAADEALYRAKANGRNRVEATEPVAMEGLNVRAPSIVPLLGAGRHDAAPARNKRFAW